MNFDRIIKISTTFARIVVGCIFIFSGTIKSNDPKGTGIKLNEYFDVFASSQKQAQDTVHLMVKGVDIDINDYVDFVLSPLDTVLKLAINQSAPGMAKFDDEEDSLYGSMIYVVKNNEELYSYFMPFEGTDTAGRILFQTSVSGTTNKMFADTMLFLSANSKYEIESDVPAAQLYKKDNFLVGFFTGLKPYSLSFSIIMCILEVILGFAILIGWKPKLMTWSIMLMILFFTFLTWYSAYYNKVTDCGCFGDFIKLKPWTSFTKDVVLLVLILIIFFRKDKIIPLFSPLFSINAMIVVTLTSTVFTIYCSMFLPAWDFLPYKAGNNIREMMTPPKGVSTQSVYENVLVYRKGNQTDSFVFPKMPPDTTWKFVDRLDRLVKEGWKSPIHGFDFEKRDEFDINLKDTLLYSKGYHILVVSAHLEDANNDAWVKIKRMAEDMDKLGVKVYGLTSSPIEMADQLCIDNQLPFKFRNSDETLLKTIIRSNPGIMLIHDGCVMDKWSSRSIPSVNKIRKIMKKHP